jgi:hypothetical protein
LLLIYFKAGSGSNASEAQGQHVLLPASVLLQMFAKQEKQFEAQLEDKDARIREKDTRIQEKDNLIISLKMETLKMEGKLYPRYFFMPLSD